MTREAYLSLDSRLNEEIVIKNYQQIKEKLQPGTRGGGIDGPVYNSRYREENLH